jgi:hypothetical protein
VEGQDADEQQGAQEKIGEAHSEEKLARAL